jgi:hypothetical protein
MPEPSKKVIWV